MLSSDNGIELRYHKFYARVYMFHCIFNSYYAKWYSLRSFKQFLCICWLYSEPICNILVQTHSQSQVRPVCRCLFMLFSSFGLFTLTHKHTYTHKLMTKSYQTDRHGGPRIQRLRQVDGRLHRRVLGNDPWPVSLPHTQQSKVNLMPIYQRHHQQRGKHRHLLCCVDGRVHSAAKWTAHGGQCRFNDLVARRVINSVLVCRYCSIRQRW